MTKASLYNRALRLMRDFCTLNAIPPPKVKVVPKGVWKVGVCAFYRPDIETEKKWTLPGHVRGINICLDLCQHPCGEEMSRNWSWPGNAVDRTPFGVVLHELGHHCDWYVSNKKGRYYGNCSVALHKKAHGQFGEPGITTYADTSPPEYFAEAFRLFVTNPTLLRELRPVTCTMLNVRFRPLRHGAFHWRRALGFDCPKRVVTALERKGARPLDPRLDHEEWFTKGTMRDG